MGLVAAIRPQRANGGMVPEGDTEALQQFARSTPASRPC